MSQYLVTTAINYTNGPPHIGHCYEAILTDMVARWRRLSGDQVFFQTGTDEHGLKIAQTAEKLGISPKELCDSLAEVFKKLDNQLEISYDYFIRTTDSYHKNYVMGLFNKLKEKGDIYLGEYSGWYNVREETFITDQEALNVGFKDPVTGVELTKMQEPSYFFKLGSYRDRIIQALSDGSVKIVPESAKTLVLKRLDDELRDLSISRTNFKWGVPVPGDPDHCLYVWMDALFNYYTGPCHSGFNSNWDFSDLEKTKIDRSRLWKVDLHVIGKDITWFHTAIWFGLLMAAEFPLPKALLVHEFISAEDGRKMSKSVGNVLDLNVLLSWCPVPTLRYYLLKESAHHETDIKFSVDRVKVAHDSELADKLGNLVGRILVMPGRMTSGVVPDCKVQGLFDLNDLIGKLSTLMSEFKVSEYVKELQSVIHLVNTHLSDNKVWEIQNPKYPDDTRTESERKILVRSYLSALYVIAVLWSPIQPSVSNQILECFDCDHSDKLEDLSFDCLKPGISVSKLKNKILFQKFQSRQ